MEQRKISYHRQFKVKGVTFPCSLDSSWNRQDILQLIIPKFEKLRLQEFEYKGEPAYYIVSSTHDLDIGTVPADVVPRIKKYENRDYELQLIELDSFYNERDERIYYAKVQFIVYSDAPVQNKQDISCNMTSSKINELKEKNSKASFFKRYFGLGK